MAGDRFVLLGLARARSDWFRRVAGWSNAAALPTEFVKCVSANELRARLSSGRPFSAALLDAGAPSVDRDLIEAVRDASCVPLIVEDGRAARDWISLGAAAVLPQELTRELLLDCLATQAIPISAAAAGPIEISSPGLAETLGSVAAVVGPGGTGASTLAIALSQGLASAGGGSVALADLCRHADQAMLHDARDVFPGVQELVDAHRSGRPQPDEIRAGTFHVEERGYHLLLGLRRARYWSTIRPHAFDTALIGLRTAFATVVCDIDGDLEGEDDAGSADIAERNHMSRTAVREAAAVFAVGEPGLKGLHALVRLVAGLTDAGVESGRILPIINRCPRHPKQRAALTASFAPLARAATGAQGLLSPLFVPRRRLEDALRDGVALPAPLPALLAGAWRGLLQRVPLTPPVPASHEPERVAPGSLGAWSSQGAHQ